MNAATGTEPIDQEKLTRAQKAMLALSNEVATQLAEDHGVCIRPLAMRRIDQSSGRVDVVPVPCGSTREDQCRPCAEKARRLRMVQCREGWHLENEPITKPADPTAAQKELMTVRADLHAAYTDARAKGDDGWDAENRAPGAGGAEGIFLVVAAHAARTETLMCREWSVVLSSAGLL